MAVYAVIYDLNQPGQDYTRLIAMLEKTDHCHAQQSFWLIAVNQTLAEVLNNVSSFTDGSDNVFVTQVFASCWGSWKMPAAATWLTAHGVR